MQQGISEPEFYEILLFFLLVQMPSFLAVQNGHQSFYTSGI